MMNTNLESNLGAAFDTATCPPIQNDTQNIMRNMAGLMCALEKLASNPDATSGEIAEFVKIDSAFKPGPDQDGMLGSMMLEGMLGLAFSEVAANLNTADTAQDWADHIPGPLMDHADFVVDAVDAYQEDRAKKEERAFMLGIKSSKTGVHSATKDSRAPVYGIAQKNSISAGFNGRSQTSEAYQKYMRDLPRRMGIERSLDDQQRAYFANKRGGLFNNGYSQSSIGFSF